MIFPHVPATPAPSLDVAAFQRALLAWFRKHQRPLPWREAPNPYKTVVSEFMLQQTQVKTVLPYFSAWLRQFPDFPSLARAPESSVLKAWEGLGYYSRARNLHRLAQALAALPALPTERSAWMELPGIGPYTSAAITSISFGQPEACVDGNVVRILARIHADDTRFRDSASAAKGFAVRAEALLNHAHPGDHNQAMMELGATVCHRQSPLCTVCPVLPHCQAGQAGNPEDYPRLAPKTIEKVEVERVWCLERNRLLLRRGAKGARRLADLHELPTLSDLGISEPGRLPLLTVKKRSITRFQYTERIWSLRRPAEPLAAALVWVSLEELATITLSGPHRRWVTELLASPTQADTQRA